MKSSGPVEKIHLLRNTIWIFFFAEPVRELIFFAETCAGVNEQSFIPYYMHATHS